MALAKWRLPISVLEGTDLQIVPLDEIALFLGLVLDRKPLYLAIVFQAELRLVFAPGKLLARYRAESKTKRSSLVFSCGLLDGVEDAHVAGAAAEVSGEAFLDLGEGWVGVFVEEMVGGQDHARGADAALGSAAFEEALLDRVKFFG